MDGIFEIKEKLQELYAERSRLIDKGVQFLIALITFYLINVNVGFMETAASPVVALALAVICAFFPVIVTVLAATALILVHMYAVSLGMLIVTALVFLIMYIFYFRLTSKMWLIVVLTPVAFALKIPFVVPMAYALISTPVAMVAVVCGTIVYYMMEYVKKAAPGLSGENAANLMTQISAYIKQVFQDKEMWIVIVSFMIAFMIVYTVRRQSVNHAWKVAIGSGAVANVIVNIIGDVALGVHISFGSLLMGSIVAVLVGLVLEVMFFSVDYTKSENLQYEDDEYYYFVKAVPKISVARPEKTVKRITGHPETEIMDADTVREHREQRKGSRHSQRRSSRERKLEQIDGALSARQNNHKK